MNYSLMELVINLVISVATGSLVFLCINKAFGITSDGSASMRLMLFMEWFACSIIIFAGVVFIASAAKGNISTDDNSLDKVGIYMKDKKYSMAVQELDNKINISPENTEYSNLKSILQGYINAKSLYESGKYSESKSILDNINKEYIKYKYIKEDIDYLITSVDTVYNQKEDYTKLKVDITTLINDKKYADASQLISKTETLNLSDEEKAYISQLNTKIKNELSKEDNGKASISSKVKSNNSEVSNEKSSKSKTTQKGRYYVAKHNKYVNSEDELMELYNSPSNEYRGFDYIDTKTGSEYWFNPASVKADGYYE